MILLVIPMMFGMMKMIKGNLFRTTDRAVPPAIQANLERKYNLDKPWYWQYAYYVKGVFTFDLGLARAAKPRRQRRRQGALRLDEARRPGDALRDRLRYPTGIIAALNRTRSGTTPRWPLSTPATPYPTS